MPSYRFGPCPVCAGSRGRVVAGRTEIVAELEALWTHYSVPALPPAELADRLAFTLHPPLAVVRCRRCGLLYRNPRERDVREAYEGEAVDEQRLEQLRELQADAFQPLVERLTALNGWAGRGLEVGSYTGAFLAAAAAAGWEFRGVDVNPAVVAFLRRHGHHVTTGAIEDTPPGAAYDVIAFWNCFDQLADPVAAARAAAQRLRAGGIMAVRVPNGAFYAALRPRLESPVLRVPARTLLARHNLLGFPYRHGFTAASLERLLRAAGFHLLDAGAAALLPAADPQPGARALRLLEQAIRPLAGPPWLEAFARRT
jgi:SAM-dependent methyltransferase